MGPPGVEKIELISGEGYRLAVGGVHVISGKGRLRGQSGVLGALEGIKKNSAGTGPSRFGPNSIRVVGRNYTHREKAMMS